MKHLILAIAVVSSPALADEITPDLVAGLPPVDILYLGELHDNPWHHETQAAVVAEMAPAAIVFEMLTPDMAGRVASDLIGNKDKLQAVLEWDQSGWPSFDMYYPIFAAASGAAFYGAQVPRDAVRAAIMDGDVIDAFGPDAERYGLTDPLPLEEQQMREAKQFEAHCNALPEHMLPGMVLGQRLRDATMAQVVDRALADTGGPVVVITGNGHARLDWGAPALVSSGATQRSIAQVEAAPDGPVPYDFYIVTPATDRADPCLAFKKE
ncbi:ChaN family lipoprotein [Shimia sp. SDUM112013]|uniref:ChaN family lipoprotein n=1 Tax=Shimia sp. SDUM112013 TaxID=3136160 RepID=UPI0032EDFAF7